MAMTKEDKAALEKSVKSAVASAVKSAGAASSAAPAKSVAKAAGSAAPVSGVKAAPVAQAAPSKATKNAVSNAVKAASAAAPGGGSNGRDDGSDKGLAAAASVGRAAQPAQMQSTRQSGIAAAAPSRFNTVDPNTRLDFGNLQALMRRDLGGPSRLAGTRATYDPAGDEFVDYQQYLANLQNGTMGRPGVAPNTQGLEMPRSSALQDRIDANGGVKPFDGPVDWGGIRDRFIPGNSEKYKERLAANGGVKPFDGPVDWGGLAGALGFGGAAPTVAEEAATGLKTRSVPIYDTDENGNPVTPIDIMVRGGNTGLRGPNMTVAERNALADPDLPGTGGTQYFPKGGNYGYNAVTGAYETRQPGVAYLDQPLTEQEVAALAAINNQPAQTLAAEAPVLDTTGTIEAPDLFESDGLVTTPTGEVIRPGAPAAKVVPEEPAEPSTWDNIVDNTGKLLSHTGLGAVVSTLFPELWDGMGNNMKGLDDGNSRGARNTGPADPNAWKTPWTTHTSENGPAPLPAAFPDLNFNGIDDRIEGYVAPRAPEPNPPTVVAPGGDAPAQYDRYGNLVFPDIPPYRPGIDDEWLYYRKMARGGLVGYAEGGEVMPAAEGGPPMVDKIALIGDTEDVLERIQAGTQPSEDDTTILKGFVAQFGDAALKQLYENVAKGMKLRPSGRQVEGPGGPTDDMVPARVDDGEEVRLSNGEFIMPVAAVEGFGDGDASLGAERMQELSRQLADKRAANGEDFKTADSSNDLQLAKIRLNQLLYDKKLSKGRGLDVDGPQYAPINTQIRELRGMLRGAG